MNTSINQLFKPYQKIAFLTPTLWPYSGIDRVVEDYAVTLTTAHKDVTIYCLNAKIKIPGVKVKVLGLPRSKLIERIYRLFLFLNLPLLFKMSAELKTYDCVVCHHYPMTILGSFTKLRYRTPYINWNYGVPPAWTFSNVVEKIYIIFFNWLASVCMVNANLVVSISKFLEKQSAKVYSGQTLVVYPEASKLTEDTSTTHKLKQQLEIKKNDKVLLYIGRLSPHKGVHLLIDSFLALQPELPLKLILVGKPTFSQYFTDLRKKVNNDKRIIFVTNATDEELGSYYALAEIYITASFWEGFNLPLATALKLRKKAVAFSVAAHIEFKNIHLVPFLGDNEKSRQALVATIQNVL